MPEPTGHDADLYTRLLALTLEAHHSEERRFVLSEFAAESYEEFQHKYPPGSDGRQRLVNVLGFFEAAGVLVSRGLLHEDVFFDSPFGLDGVWAKTRVLMEQWQEAAGDPATWENAYWLGLRYDAWLKERTQTKLEMVPPDKGPLEKEQHVTVFAR